MIRADFRPPILRCAAPSPIIAAMSEADELARRFLALWADYLAAVASDPQNAEIWRRWLEVAIPAPAKRDDAGIDGNPPRPPAGAAAAAGAFGERDDAVAELARRIEGIEQRLAALERGRREPVARPRGGNRAKRT
ncbi:MAG TPA: hypothetical protein VND87_09695 [Stellaceae bacterium]|nr:hypothetical protein [Stellaceae bacterium]